MKFLAFIFFAFSIHATAANLGESKVTEVTVFKDRAYVKRNQVIKLEKGPHSLIFNGITPLADPESLKVTVREKSKVRVLGMRNEKKFLLESKNKLLTGYKLEQNQLLQQQEKLFEKADSLNHESENLRLLSNHYSDSFS